MIEKSSLDNQEAGRILGLCRLAAEREGVAVTVAVADDAGQLLGLMRMDGARGYTVELATRKARIAATVGVPTRIITEMARANPVPASEAAVGAGGLPVVSGTFCMGAIGVSGARPEVDEAVASAGLAALA